VETSDTWSSGLGVPQSSSWSTVGEDGVTEGPTQIGYDCHSGKALPYEMRPAAKYRGEVTLDDGSVVLGILYPRELALARGTDISAFGDWRAYMRNRGATSPSA